MKKVISALAAIAVFGGVALTASSCNPSRDWNCKCTDSNGNSQTYLIQDKTRTEAKAECDTKINVGGFTYTCKIEYL